MANVKDVEEAVIAEEPTKEQVELSKEELAERRKEITDYYKDNIKHLKIQLEYEELLMNIEKTRAERIQAQMFLAQATKEDNREKQQQKQQPHLHKLKLDNNKKVLLLEMSQREPLNVLSNEVLKRTSRGGCPL